MPEPHAMLAQCAARILIQFLDLSGHIIARNHAQMLDQPECKAAGQTGQRFVARHRQQRVKQCSDFAVDEMLHPATHFVGNIGACFVIDESLDQRTTDLGPLHHLAHRHGAPHQAALLGEIHFRVGRVVETVRAQMEFRL